MNEHCVLLRELLKEIINSNAETCVYLLCTSSSFSHVSKSDHFHISVNKNIWKIFPKSVHALSAVFQVPVLVKAASFERLSLASCIYVQVKSDQGFWIILPVNRNGTWQFPIVLAVWSDAGWMPYVDHTVLDPIHHWRSSASSSLLPASSPNQSTYCSCSGTDEPWSARWWSTIRIRDLQRGVDVDKDDDYQVENGPNDAQHGQDALLLTFLVLDSLFFITMESVYHFPWKSLQFPSQTNLQRADKTEKRKVQKSYCNWSISPLKMVFTQCMVDSNRGNKTTIKVICWGDGWRKWNNE